jgi:hypothetical protein
MESWPKLKLTLTPTTSKKFLFFTHLIQIQTFIFILIVKFNGFSGFCRIFSLAVFDVKRPENMVSLPSET